MAVRSLGQVVIWPGLAWPSSPLAWGSTAPHKYVKDTVDPGIHMADQDLPDEAPHGTTGPASSSNMHTYSRIHTRVFALSVALKHTLTHKDRIAGATVTYQQGGTTNDDEEGPLLHGRCLDCREHVFPYHTYILSLFPSQRLGTLALITPWLPRQISQRSWGQGKPHARSLPHTAPCHVSHVASRFAYKLSHCPPFDDILQLASCQLCPPLLFDIVRRQSS